MIHILIGYTYIKKSLHVTRRNTPVVLDLNWGMQLHFCKNSVLESTFFHPPLFSCNQPLGEIAFEALKDRAGSLCLLDKWIELTKMQKKTRFCTQIWAQTSWLPCCVFVTKTFTRCSYELHMSFDTLHFHFCEVRGVGVCKVWKVTILWLFEFYVHVFVQPMSFCFLKELCVHMWGQRESKGGGRRRWLESMLGAWKEKLIQGVHAFRAHLLLLLNFFKIPTLKL